MLESIYRVYGWAHIQFIGAPLCTAMYHMTTPGSKMNKVMCATMSYMDDIQRACEYEGKDFKALYTIITQRAEEYALEVFSITNS